MAPHPIVDKALEEGWPLSELIDVCEIFGYELRIIERGEVSPNKDVEPPVEQEPEMEPEQDLLGLVEEFKSEPERARKRWTVEERMAVYRYWQSGMTVESVAELMGRTTKSIRHQYNRLDKKQEEELHNDHDA
ncbi:hypothetical protein QP999_02945 [Corynebacterium sp. MSK004]|uniref:hypothetical protein n=1 Tax=Corynebacterium sp. MSK004 TaxID=3050186 RepID=UPI0025513DF3|nr:hypothetical protein [Corynebacterium sp. MSK004]MDK8896899.1 hypothetical protein [Corynebacterium sp. MSK004]